MKRIYHPVDLWEEMDFNMWGEAESPKDMLQEAVDFTGNHVLYGSYMKRVINEWRYSCENALTDLNLNRKAWLGHAACALALQCPEDITRKAWGYLNNEQKQLANNQATYFIRKWEIMQEKNRGVYKDLEIPLL